jgi:hypothetical protein
MLQDVARVLKPARELAWLDPLLGDRRAFGDQRLQHPGRANELEVGRGTRSHRA